jgi:DUF2892 family protein
MKMTVEEGLRMIAGTFVLVSLALGIWVNPWWFAFTAFVGANLLQSAFTRWCPMMFFLKRAGFAETRESAGPKNGAEPLSRPEAWSAR